MVSVILQPVEVPYSVFLYVLTGIDQTDCKPDPASLQTDAPPPKLKEETLQPVVFNNQVIILFI